MSRKMDYFVYIIEKDNVSKTRNASPDESVITRKNVEEEKSDLMNISESTTTAAMK